MRRYERVEVEWVDASHWSAGRSRKEVKEECKLTTVRTVGYLIQKGREVIRIAGDYNEYDEFRDTNVIPRPDVRRITYLTEKK